MSKLGTREKLYNLKKHILNYMRHILPFRDGMFTPDLVSVIDEFTIGLFSGELLDFMSKDISSSRTYGMSHDEIDIWEVRYDSDSKLLVDQSAKPITSYEVIYVVTKEGKLITEPRGKKIAINHSSICLDGAVICAGQLAIEHGKIIYIDNNSGHYMPSSFDLFNALKVLSARFGEAAFHLECKISPFEFQTLKKITTFSISEFNSYMQEDIGGLKRVELLQREKIDSWHKQREKIIPHKVKFKSGELISQINEIRDNFAGKKIIFNIPKDSVIPAYAEYYRSKYNIRAEDFKSLTLTPNQLMEYLASMGAEATMINLVILNLELDINKLVKIERLGEFKAFVSTLEERLLSNHRYNDILSLINHSPNKELIAARILSQDEVYRYLPADEIFTLSELISVASITEGIPEVLKAMDKMEEHWAELLGSHI